MTDKLKSILRTRLFMVLIGVLVGSTLPSGEGRTVMMALLPVTLLLVLLGWLAGRADVREADKRDQSTQPK